MTLLQTIAAASANPSGELSPSHTNFPYTNQIFPNLKEITSEPETKVKPASGFKIPNLDADLNGLLNNLCSDLKHKLKNPNTFTKNEFVSLINSFFKTGASKLGMPISTKSHVAFMLDEIESLGVLISREVANLIAEGCILFEIWSVLGIIIERNFVGNLICFNLVEKLAKNNKTELICLCVRKIPNLRPSEVFEVLKYFLSVSDESYIGMVKVRKEWESEAGLAIEKVKETGLSKKTLKLVKDASILLMMALDGFYSSEICLHYVFSSKNFDGLVLSSAISKLDGYEVLNLVRYFVKWLEKYERFPQAKPCVSAGPVLGLRKCESVPTLEDVVRGLKLVLNEHFSYLVLNTEFHDELKKVESSVGMMVLEADLCCPVHDIVKHLKELRKHERQ